MDLKNIGPLSIDIMYHSLSNLHSMSLSKKVYKQFNFADNKDYEIH